MQKMRIAMMGMRGVPANFGGSETAVEEIGSRLVARGHEVTVYCRKHKDTVTPGATEYKGMKRIVLPSVHSLNMELLSHSGLCLLDMVRRRFDVVHFHGVGNSLLFPLFKLTGRGAKSLLIVDGPDWKRPKWGKMAQYALRASFPMAVKLADEIISDNEEVLELFRKDYGRVTQLVGYGADMNIPQSRAALTKFGVEPGKYFLQVGALVPDKGVHIVIEAFEKLKTELPLLIVGDTPYMSEYKTKLMATQDKRIKFLGYVFGEEYRELVANCFGYVHGQLVDGTSPALLQAMAYGRGIIAGDLLEIDHSLADTGLRYRVKDPADLRAKMTALIENPGLATEYGAKARRRVEEKFNWERVTDDYERLSLQIMTGSKQS